MRLVDADALELEYQEQYKLFTWDDGEREKATLARVIQMLHAQPTIEELKKGKWRYSRNISSISYSDMMITCDQCGYTKERSHGDVFNFCPSCGARMEGNT